MKFDFLGRSLEYCPATLKTPDGVSLAAQDWRREASGRDVLMIHGFSQSHLCWFKQVTSALAQEFRLATYDNRGHGMSGKPADPAFYRDSRRWADEVKTVIDGLRLHRPVIVAWSYAGRIVLDYLTVYGSAGISGLVMVGATSSTGLGTAGPAAGLLKEMAALELAPSIEASRRFARSCFVSAAPPEEMEVMLASSAATPSAVRAALIGRPADYASTLQAIEAPTLVVHGASDRIVLPAVGRYTADMVPDAALSIYEDIGHAPFLEAPDRFNDELSVFLRQTA